MFFYSSVRPRKGGPSPANFGGAGAGLRGRGAAFHPGLEIRSEVVKP